MSDRQEMDFAKPEPIVIRADNVSRYVLEHGLEQGWDDLLNFRCSRPPFPNMQINFLAPTFETPVSMIASEMPKDFTIQSKGVDNDGVCDRIKRFQSDLSSKGLERFLMLQQQSPKGQVINIVGLGKSGEVLCDDKGVAYLRIASPKMTAEFEKWQTAGDFFLVVGLATMNFLNCRNVEVVDNPPSRQCRRHCERTGEPLPVTYKTLVIHPNLRRRKIYQQAGVSTDRALHIVRGHFKDFRRGPGLGKYAAHGLWWWSPNVRGTASDRAIVKDYSVQVN